MLRTCLCTAVNVVVTVFSSYRILRSSGPFLVGYHRRLRAAPLFVPFSFFGAALFRAGAWVSPFLEPPKNPKNPKTHLMEGTQNDPIHDVEAANIVEMSSPIGDIRNEAQARELAPPVKEAWDRTNWSQKPTPWTPQKQPPCKVRVQHEDPRAVAKAVGRKRLPCSGELPRVVLLGRS
jgi:hypothetical protein